MPTTREMWSDSRRDADRHNRVLLALNRATDEVRRMEHEARLDIDEVLDRLLPDLAQALNAENAFVAALGRDEDRGQNWFELTAVYPNRNLRGRHLKWSELLQQIVQDGEPRVIDPLGKETSDPIPGLDIFDSTSAILVRMQTSDTVRIVGLCNKADPSLGPYLAADRMTLNNIVELVALGARVGERRRRELESIQKTSSAISAELDLDELLQMIAKKAAEVFGAAATSLMLWDESGEYLVIRASWGLSDEYAQQQVISRKKAYTPISPSGKFLPFTVVDLRLEPFGEIELIEREKLCTVLVVPLEIHGEPIGALNIYTKDTSRQFTRDEKELASIFANQAVIAIQNAQIYQQVTQHARAMESLEQVGRTITADLDLDQVSRLIVQNANEVLAAEISSLFFYNESEEELFPFGIGNINGNIQTLPRDWRPQIKDLVASVVRDRGPIVIEDTTPRDLATNNGSTTNNRIGSSAGCPLLVGEAVLGLLFVDFCAPHRFTNDELQTILMFASQAAVAIKNARQYEDIKNAYQETEKAKKRLDIVAVISQAVRSTLDFDRVLDTLLNELGKVIDAPDRGILLYEEASDELVIHPSSTYCMDSDKKHITRTPVSRGITGWVARERKSSNVPDVTKDPRYLKRISTTRSELAVPIVHGDELIGVINLESPTPAAFDEEDAMLLQAIADQVAIAIQNARRYHELEQAKNALAATEAVAWMGLFGSSWAHGVTQKTSAVRNYLVVLADYLPQEGPEQELLARIEEAVKAIQGIPIVQRLPSEPRMTAALDLDAALRKQAQHWCRSHPAIELDFDLRCGGIRTHIDEGWLDIALEKLINNALKAMPNGGHLEVASIFRGRKAEVTITDSGQGISEKVRPYFLKERIPPEFSGSSGTGIGALIAQYIFRAFGGDLELLWSEPGRGTTLRVTLPATPSEAFQTTHAIG